MEQLSFDSQLLLASFSKHSLRMWLPLWKVFGHLVISEITTTKSLPNCTTMPMTGPVFVFNYFNEKLQFDSLQYYNGHSIHGGLWSHFWALFANVTFIMEAFRLYWPPGGLRKNCFQSFVSLKHHKMLMTSPVLYSFW